ncbi:polygalacturonase-like [Hibiscus syriacus]|uniref:polygalacturonase-like n=1 Tax=Hibiscus syriacus TaxID=106335 RepID=UPI00192278F1|nr:polygalacturonase-like [Hibiscus syriacus]
MKAVSRIYVSSMKKLFCRNSGSFLLPFYIQALLNAWKQACASATPAAIVVPKGAYMLSQALLNGPCEAHITLKVHGIIMAPADPKAFKDSNWVAISFVDGLTITGGGVFDGKGSGVWGKSSCGKNYCDTLPFVSQVSWYIC